MSSSSPSTHLESLVSCFLLLCPGGLLWPEAGEVGWPKFAAVVFCLGPVSAASVRQAAGHQILAAEAELDVPKECLRMELE